MHEAGRMWLAWALCLASAFCFKRHLSGMIPAPRGSATAYRRAGAEETGAMTLSNGQVEGA